MENMTLKDWAHIAFFWLMLLFLLTGPSYDVAFEDYAALNHMIAMCLLIVLITFVIPFLFLSRARVSTLKTLGTSLTLPIVSVAAYASADIAYYNILGAVAGTFSWFALFNLVLISILSFTLSVTLINRIVELFEAGTKKIE